MTQNIKTCSEGNPCGPTWRPLMAANKTRQQHAGEYSDKAQPMRSQSQPTGQSKATPSTPRRPERLTNRPDAAEDRKVLDNLPLRKPRFQEGHQQSQRLGRLHAVVFKKEGGDMVLHGWTKVARNRKRANQSAFRHQRKASACNCTAAQQQHGHGTRAQTQPELTYARALAVGTQRRAAATHTALQQQ